MPHYLCRINWLRKSEDFQKTVSVLNSLVLILRTDMPLTTLFGVSLFMTGFLIGAFIVALWMRARFVELDAARKVAEMNLHSAQQGAGKTGENFQAMADAALR